MAEQRVNILVYRPEGTLIAQYLLGDGEHLIGREIHCPVYLDSEHISKNHAKLHLSAEGIYIEDLNSTSGTFLNGVTVRGKLRVKPGQVLQVGDLTIDLQPESTDNIGPGSRLADGRYTLIRLLGRGGMGEVWLAKDGQLEEEVALKKLPPEVGADAMALADMRREVQKSRALSHPNIIRIHDLYSKSGEDPLITLEYVDGTDLTAIAATKTNGIFNWAEIEPLILQLCSGLEYAHEQKIVHRDLKPANMMVSRKSQVKLADFGIAATMADSLSRSSMQGLISGTTLYMSPQQMEGDAPRASDDIYAFGATLYELLTSRPPFYTGDVQHQVQEVIPKPMDQRLAEFGFTNEIPEHVHQLVMSCLAKEPEGRPKDMSAIIQWIKSKGQEKGAVPKHTTKTVRRSRKIDKPLEAELTPAKKGAKIVVMAAVIVVVIGLGIWAKNQITELGSVQQQAQNAGGSETKENGEKSISTNNPATQTTNSNEGTQPVSVTPKPPPTIVVTPKPGPTTPVQPVAPPVKPNLPPPTVTADTNIVSAHGLELKFLTLETDTPEESEVNIIDSEAYWSPDGSMLAIQFRGITYGYSGQKYGPHIRIIDALNGRVLRSFQVQETFRQPSYRGGPRSPPTLDRVGRLAWSPDGTKLAYNYRDTRGSWGIEIRNIVTEEIEAQFSFKEHFPDAYLSWSPDGKKLAAASTSKILRIIDVNSGKELQSKAIMDGLISPVAWDPDSARIACASHGNTVRIINATDGKLIDSLNGHKASISGIAWSGDGARLFSSGGGVKAWNLSTGKEYLNFEKWGKVANTASSRRNTYSWYKSFSLSPDGKLIAKHDSSEITIGDATNGAILYRIKERALGISWSPRGKRLACIQKLGAPAPSNRVRIWEITSTLEKQSAEDIAPKPTISGPSVNAGIAVGPAGAKITQVISPLEKEIYSLSWNPGGKKLATGAGVVQVWDVDKAKELQFHMGDQATTSKIVAWSPDGKTLAATSKGSDRVSIFDLETEKEIKSHKAPSGAINYNLSWHPEGKLLVGDGANKINLINDSDQLYKQASGTALNGILTAVLSPAKDGAIAVGDTNGDISVLNIGTTNILHISGHKKPVRNVAWSPDAKKLASVSDDRTLRIWDATTGKALQVLRGHAGFIKSVSWSRDGRRLASGSSIGNMGEIVVWEATTGKVLHVMNEKGPIQCIAWSPDSTQLATGGDEKTVKLWDFPEK